MLLQFTSPEARLHELLVKPLQVRAGWPTGAKAAAAIKKWEPLPVSASGSGAEPSIVTVPPAAVLTRAPAA